jgi:acyl carrier protein
MDEIQEVKRVLAEIADIEPETLQEDVELQLQGIDSLMLINAVVQLEAHFSLELSGSELDLTPASTLRDLTKLITQARAAAA